MLGSKLGKGANVESIVPPPFPPSQPIALTIAGHDPSSGAGITADLLVFAAHGIFGTSAITSLTVQSTQGVAASEPLSDVLISKVLFNLQADLPPAGVKIGMLGTAEAVLAVVNYLQRKRKHDEDNDKILIVLDPILISSSGAPLLSPEGVDAMRQWLLPLVDWVTPNWSELAVLSGLPVDTIDNAINAAAVLGAQYPHINVVVTGGDQTQATDLLRLADGTLHRYSAGHIETTSTHGTGCAFSSALLSRIILGSTPVNAVAEAKSYVTEAIRRAPGLGKGKGPLNLLWPLNLEPKV
jgi:hydroxymethylpyrimidine/phosphomethylpyrimidine kinase